MNTFYEVKLLDKLHDAQSKFNKREISKKEMVEIINRIKGYISSVDESICQLNKLIDLKW